MRRVLISILAVAVFLSSTCAVYAAGPSAGAKTASDTKFVQTLDQTIANLQKRIDNIDAIATKAQAEIDKLNARKLPAEAIPVKDEIVALIQKKVADTADLHSQIKAKLVALKETLSSDQVSVADKKAALQTTNAEVKALGEQVQAITKPIEEQMKAKFAELKSVVEANKPEPSAKPEPTFEKVIAGLQKRIDNIDAIATKAQAEIDKLSTRQLPAAAIPVKDEIVALIQKKVADTADLHSQIKDKLTSLIATLKSDQVSVDDKKAAVKTVNAEIKVIDEQIKAIVMPIAEQIKAKYAELKSIVDANKPTPSAKPEPTFEKVIAGLQKRIDNIDATAAKAQAQIDKLNARELPAAAIPVKDEIVALIGKKVADTADLHSQVKAKLVSLIATLQSDQVLAADKKAAVKAVNAEIKVLEEQIKAIVAPIAEQIKAKYAELKSIVDANKPAPTAEPTVAPGAEPTAEPIEQQASESVTVLHPFLLKYLSIK